MINNQNGKMNVENVKSNDSLEKFIEQNLTAEQAEKLKNVLADEGKTKEILNSNLAKELFKKLGGK